MKLYITLCAVLITAYTSFGQRGLCYLGDFEYDLNPQFQFCDDPGSVAIDCDFFPANCSIDQNEWVFLNANVNNFSHFVTLVDDSTVEPISQLPRVYSGSRAIKLNDDIADRSITRMSYTFQLSTVTNDVISFKYLIVSENPPVNSILSNNPHFIARIYSDPNSSTEYDEICIDITHDDPDFTLTADENHLFSGWQCAELSLAGIPTTADAARLEFIITDNQKDYLFTTVYIDDICYGVCEDPLPDPCPECPNITTDVGANEDDEVQAEVCITASNTISGVNATAAYHAGEEVLLEPGFEALSGTTDRFYIEGCSGTFQLRPGSADTDTNENDVIEPVVSNGFTVYPNPAFNELNIVSEKENNIVNISLYAVDGKLILNMIPANNTTSTTVDISTVSKGLYLLSVQTGDGEIITKRIVKN